MTEQATTFEQPVFDDQSPSEEEEYFDTYSFGGTGTYTLPDKKQSITFKLLNEGDKVKFQRITNRDIRLNRKTEEASFRPDAAAERHALITIAVTGWNLFTKQGDVWVPLQFSDTMLGNWLQLAPPKIVEELEEAIRKANPWLGLDDVTEEELENQIKELQDQLEEKRRRDLGKH